MFEEENAPSMKRINPFQPQSAVNPGMFVGRIPQLNAVESALLQTRAGKPKNFMLTGERGIGKQVNFWKIAGNIGVANPEIG